MIVLTGLSVYQLGQYSFWRDEIASVVFATAPFGELTRVLDRTREVAGLANMASYYLLLHFWMPVVGDGESQVRLLSVIFGVATVVPVHLVARRIAGWWAAVAATMIFALSPTVVEWNQQARGYSLAMLVGAGLTLLLVLAVERRNAWLWLAYGLLASFGIYVHFFLGLVIAAHLGWVLLSRSWPGWVGAAAAAVPIAIASAPIPFLVAEHGGGHNWIDPLTVNVARESLSALAGSPLLLVLLAACAGIGMLERRRERWFWLVAATALLPLLGIALISVVKPFFTGRYLVVALPGVAIMAGVGLASLRSLPARTALAAAVLLATLLALPSAYADIRQEHWREAAGYVAQGAQPGDRIYLGTWSARPMTWYLERDGQPIAPQRILLPQAVERATPRLWIVFGDPGSTDALRARNRLEQQYDVVEERAFGTEVLVLLAEPAERVDAVGSVMGGPA